VAYDRADWHYGGDYPEGLPQENAGTHIGLFLAWIIKNNLVGDFHQKESCEYLIKVRNEEISGRDFLIDMCDEKFWEEDLSEEGQSFTNHYYESDLYLNDYDSALSSNLETLYHVENSWDNYYKLAPLISAAYNKWKKPKKFWQFWK
jgi:hypothetical protein